MGYSARYHAASLLAVFAALLIGIVVGAGLGSEVVSDTRSSLEGSLEQDLEEARAEADDLRREAERQRSYADRSYPLVVRGRLRGKRIAIIGLGDASVTTTREIERAVDPAGANLTAVGILSETPDRAALAEALRVPGNTGLMTVGRTLGRSMAGRGVRAGRAQDEAFSRVSGELSQLEGVVLVRAGDQPTDAVERAAAFESAIVDGLTQRTSVVVGAERFGRSGSAIGWFQRIGVDGTVDNIEEVAGKTSLVFALRGVSGDFGRKETASRLIPDLLTVASRSRE